MTELRNMRNARLVNVVEVQVREGEGTGGADQRRVVSYYYSEDGDLLATRDPIASAKAPSQPDPRTLIESELQIAKLKERETCARDVCRHCGMRVGTHDATPFRMDGALTYSHAPRPGTGVSAVPCVASAIWEREARSSAAGVAS